MRGKGGVGAAIAEMMERFYAHSIEGKPVDEWHRLEEHEGTAPGQEERCNITFMRREAY